ncbi:MAG TPA: DapH/DapD/GlmU-related protein [Solirubrobacteraceae bacterium]|jgi:acetyltransferase-like isoleucine patch superfamily enzyme
MVAPDSPADGSFVAPDVVLGEGVELAPGAVVHAGVRLGAQSRIGSGAVVHAGTQVGERCVVEDGAVLGKRPSLRPGSSAEGGELAALVLDDEVIVCAGAVVYAGARIGRRAIIGDQSQVRERSSVGERTVVGRASCVDFDARVGAHVSIQTGVYVTGGSIVEDDVFLGPGVLTTNDSAMGRHPRGEPLSGPHFKRACRVGSGVVLTPGVTIGEEAFVAAGALVTRDVGDRQVVMGSPARVVREVPEEDLIENWR